MIPGAVKMHSQDFYSNIFIRIYMSSRRKYVPHRGNKINFLPTIFWGIFWKSFVSIMIHLKKRLTGLCSQRRNQHSADWSVSDLHVIPIWQLLNKWKEMCDSFRQTLVLRGSGGTRDESPRKSALEARVRVAWLSAEITMQFFESFLSICTVPSFDLPSMSL